VDSLAGNTVANSAAFTMPIPPIAVFDKPIKKPISTKRRIRLKLIMN
jgi:hypothetical protein